MKKLLVGILLLLSTISFGQDSPFYMKAETFELGIKNSENKVIWDESKIKSCDILIKLDGKEATIYSNVIQKYKVISYDGKINGVSRWYCSNDSGNRCNLYLSDIKNQPGKLGLVIEFDDYSWFYICKPKNN